MAFKKIGSLDSHGSQILRKGIVTNSVKVTIGDTVQATSGFIALGTAGALVLGHINGIITDNGVGVTSDGIGGDYTNAYTVASDNQTVAQVAVLLDISKNSLYSVTPDSTVGTTTGSNLLGYHTDIVSASATDESSAITATAQYAIHGVDPMETGNQVVNIYESQVFGV